MLVGHREVNQLMASSDPFRLLPQLPVPGPLHGGVDLVRALELEGLRDTTRRESCAESQRHLLATLPGPNQLYQHPRSSLGPLTAVAPSARPLQLAHLTPHQAATLQLPPGPARLPEAAKGAALDLDWVIPAPLEPREDPTDQVAATPAAPDTRVDAKHAADAPPGGTTTPGPVPSPSSTAAPMVSSQGTGRAGGQGSKDTRRSHKEKKKKDKKEKKEKKEKKDKKDRKEKGRDKEKKEKKAKKEKSSKSSREKKRKLNPESQIS